MKIINVDIEPTEAMYLHACSAVALYKSESPKTLVDHVWRECCAAAPKVEVTDAMVERGCRAICARNNWDADRMVQRREMVPQWAAWKNDVRAALEVAFAD